MFIGYTRWAILMVGAWLAEFLMQVTPPQEVQNALWGLTLLAMGLLGVWLKSTITRSNARHDLELEQLRDNQKQSSEERKWLLETTQAQVVQIGTLQKENERLTSENRERDMEIGAQKEATRLAKAEADDLQRRTDERHDVIDKVQAEAAAAHTLAQQEKDRADAYEGDIAELRGQIEQLKRDLESTTGSNLQPATPSDKTVT